MGSPYPPPRPGHLHLDTSTKGETMYNGEDRMKQIGTLRQLASDLYEGHNVQSPVDARFTANNWKDKHHLPNWYDEYDHKLMTRYIAIEALEDMLYQKPTGHRELIEYNDDQAAELIVLTPEEIVAYRWNAIDADGPWGIGDIQEAAEYILSTQHRIAQDYPAAADVARQVRRDLAELKRLRQKYEGD